MFKARVAGGSFLIGLTRRNVELLEQDRPITFKGADVLLPSVPTVCIFFVETDAQLPSTLEKMGVPLTPEQRHELTKRLDDSGHVPKGVHYSEVKPGRVNYGLTAALDSERFYNLMQDYRMAPVESQARVVEAFEAVKTFVLERARGDQ
jgi:hypothetical protein